MNLDWISDIDPGNAAEWFSGLGALVASAVALLLGRRSAKVAEQSAHQARELAENAATDARKAARKAARESRQLAARDRTVRLFVELAKVVESDIQATKNAETLEGFPRSADGTALCIALGTHREVFDMTWSVYTSREIPTLAYGRAGAGALWENMRTEIQYAIAVLNRLDQKLFAPIFTGWVGQYPPPKH